jgi:hypothetical protein
MAGFVLFCRIFGPLATVGCSACASNSKNECRVNGFSTFNQNKHYYATTVVILQNRGTLKLSSVFKSGVIIKKELCKILKCTI